ncbi:MAG: class I SAM-dependent methyltransferase [Bryobacterales bacterium]|nr:class I SAM-dependent methyltransferase [Bryobacterales bacterium]
MKHDVAVDSAAFRSRLAELVRVHGIAVDTEALGRCESHLLVLVKWNRAMNLVGDLSLESAVKRHYGESLYLASLIPAEVRSVADIGSGAGFPGVGVAAIRRDCSVCLVESRGKKGAFLHESTRGWGNCRVFVGLGQDLQEEYEYVCSRGVDPAAVVAVARSCQSGLGLLLSLESAKEWFRMLSDEGYVGTVHEIPWRSSAAALVMAPGC